MKGSELMPTETKLHKIAAKWEQMQKDRVEANPIDISNFIPSIDDMINSLIKLYKEYNNVYIYPGHGEIGMKLKYTYNNVKRILVS